VLLPAGTEDGGIHVSVRPEAIDAFARTTTVNPTVEPPSPNDDRTVVMGLTDFVSLCFATGGIAAGKRLRRRTAR
jgi:hypothetical protein